MHTMHFRCGYDENSNKENKMRWMRMEAENQRYGPKRNSTYGHFKILCGVPNCAHPSEWDHEDFAVHRNDMLNFEHVNLNRDRNGVWRCFDDDNNRLEDGVSVPPGGHCNLKCDTEGFPEWLQPNLKIRCNAGVHFPKRNQWDQRDIGALMRQLSMPKWKNRSMRQHSESYIREVYGDTQGWKCHDYVDGTQNKK